MKQLRIKIIFLIILLFFIIKLFFLDEIILWDSAVYIGMGKYIYSFGKAGLWEASRPLGWPLILGLGWKLNLDIIFYSRLIELLFSLGCIYFTYIIGKKLFNEKIALLSTFFIAFSPTFFNFTTRAMSEIPSLFFGLLAVYFFIKKRYFLAGVSSSLSFTTRFLQLGVFLILFLFLLTKYHKKNFLRNISYFIFGFILVLLPYLVFNHIMYNNFLYPFFLQVFLTKYTGWMYYQSFWFYFLGIFKENFIFIFSVLGLFLIAKKKRYEKNLILSMFLLFFIFLSLTKHKEMRFIITFLPYLSLITAYGFYYFLDKIRNKNIKNIVLVIFLLLILAQILPQSEIEEKIDYSFFYEHVSKETSVKTIWITNPVYVVDSNKKAELIYYPTFDLTQMNKLKIEMISADLILIHSCDIPCPPWDTACFKEKPVFIEWLKQRFKVIDYKKTGECENIIMKK